jgi:hypothetical protein
MRVRNEQPTGPAAESLRDTTDAVKASQRCFAHSHLSTDPDSTKAGRLVGESIRSAFGDRPLAAVIVYATVNHDQSAVLRALREVLGDVPLVGGSGQGVIGNAAVQEGGFAVGAMGFGGPGLRAATGHQAAVEVEPARKARELARGIRESLGVPPQLFVLIYDPLGGVDVNELLAGMRGEVDCPIVGGAAGQPSGPVASTYQYHDDVATSGGAVALGLAGDFTLDLGICHGTTPTGIVMTLTRAEGNKLLALDDRPALDVWRECVGLPENEQINQDHTAALAMGIERTVMRDGREEPVYLIRAAFGFDRQRGGIVVQAAIPEGSKIMFHHRTVAVVKEGTAEMGRELAERLRDKRPWAVLGFECGARTAPFLGAADTLEENLLLQQVVAPRAPWLGIIAWGEIAPCGDEPAFFNYTYPLVVLS